MYSIAGVALAQIRFAKALAARGHKVDLIVGYVEPNLVFPAVEGVNVQILWGSPAVRRMLLPLLKYLRTVVRPMWSFSAEDHLTAMETIAAIACGSRVEDQRLIENFAD